MPKTIGYTDHFHSGYDDFTVGETGGPVFLQRVTLADTAQVIFDIPATYQAYTWKFYNICGKADSKNLLWQSKIGGSTITSTAFRAYNNSAGDDYGLAYRTGEDQAQGTSTQLIQDNIGNDPKESCSGFLTLYEPSSDTFVKHFISQSTTVMSGEGTKHDLRSGYINDTTPVSQIFFELSSGKFKAGTIAMYGIL